MRAFGEFNALVFAANQEPNHSEIHQGDFDQIQNSVSAAIADRMLAIRSDSIRPISCNLVTPDRVHTAVRLFGLGFGDGKRGSIRSHKPLGTSAAVITVLHERAKI